MVDIVNDGKLQDDFFEHNYAWFPHLPVSDNRILGIISDNLCSFVKLIYNWLNSNQQSRTKQTVLKKYKLVRVIKMRIPAQKVL